MTQIATENPRVNSSILFGGTKEPSAILAGGFFYLQIMYHEHNMGHIEKPTFCSADRMVSLIKSGFFACVLVKAAVHRGARY